MNIIPVKVVKYFRVQKATGERGVVLLWILYFHGDFLNITHMTTFHQTQPSPIKHSSRNTFELVSGSLVQEILLQFSHSLSNDSPYFILFTGGNVHKALVQLCLFLPSVADPPWCDLNLPGHVECIQDKLSHAPVMGLEEEMELNAKGKEFSIGETIQDS